MTKKELEELAGETMEDMGLEAHVRECLDCDNLIEDLNLGMVCWQCQKNLKKEVIREDS